MVYGSWDVILFNPTWVSSCLVLWKPLRIQTGLPQLAEVEMYRDWIPIFSLPFGFEDCIHGFLSLFLLPRWEMYQAWGIHSYKWLAGGFKQFFFHNIWDVILSIDVYIFQDG